MKTIVTIIIALISQLSFSQDVLFKKELKGDFEFNGHVIKDTLYFKATLDGIEIYDSKGNYFVRKKCEIENCKINHLKEKGLITSGTGYPYSQFLINQINKQQ